jgi:hypothetical protein
LAFVTWALVDPDLDRTPHQAVTSPAPRPTANNILPSDRRLGFMRRKLGVNPGLKLPVPDGRGRNRRLAPQPGGAAGDNLVSGRARNATNSVGAMLDCSRSAESAAVAISQFTTDYPAVRTENVTAHFAGDVGEHIINLCG